MKSFLSMSVSMAALFYGSQAVAEVSTALEAASNDEAVEIIITGEKTRRSLQDTKSSVGITTSARIEAENIQTFGDVVERTANVSKQFGGWGFSIRGISSVNVSGGGAGALATIYVDGAALPQRATYAGPLEMWDVGQVEIFRGPQSTLQGKNALAGAVIIRSKEPTFQYEGRGRVIVSDQGDTVTAMALGGPLIEDQVAFRVSAEKRDSEGYIYNPTRDTDEAPYDGLNARAKLLFKPAALPGLNVTATYTHSRAETGYMYTYSRTDTPDYYKNRINTSDHPNLTRNNIDIFTVESQYTLSDRLSLTGIVSYNRFRHHLDYDLDMTATSESYGTQDQTAKTFTQEAHLNYKGDRFTGVIGLYHSDRDSFITSDTYTNVITPVPTIVGGLMLSGLDYDTASMVAGLYAAALPVIPVHSLIDSPENVENTAVFGEASWQISPRLAVFGGLRYDRETYALATSQLTRFTGTFPDPANYPAYLQPAIAGINMLVEGQVAAANASSPAQPRTFEAWLPKLGVTYAFDEDRSLSFTAQQGYRSGGSVINMARSSVVPYDPEYTTNYELSWRSLWLDKSLSVNANAYYIDWTDQQVNVNRGLNEYDVETRNAGSSHLYGFELEIAHRISSSFNWYAAAGVSHTEFEDFSVSEGTLYSDFKGKAFMYAPELTLSAGGTWRGNNGLFANVNANYRSEMFQNVSNSETIKARTVVNTKVGYEATQWSAFIYANNLFDAKYQEYHLTSSPVAILGAPRTVGIILEARY